MCFDKFKEMKIYAICISLAFFGLLVSCNSADSIKQYAATESYPNDTILRIISSKRALIVIAHDDDMCAIAGTASLLNKAGWEIGVLSLERSPDRDAAHIKACRSILDTVMFVDLSPEQIRNDSEAERARYYAFPKDSIDLIFNRSVVEAAYLQSIQAFNPTVLFSLDNEMGGYGNPEHVLISQLVLDLALSKRIQAKYIYQSVYTDHMENTIMARHAKRMKSWGFPGDEWDNAKRIYGVSGMPEPSIQIKIESEAEEKMAYLRSYNKRERKTLGFFVPEFESYDAQTYFRIFNREFYRVIEL